MVGVNQVIMLSLNMVIIASMIGAGGLGFDVLAALRRLDIGTGLEAGFAIVALAIALDRLSQAYAREGAGAPARRSNGLGRAPSLSGGRAGPGRGDRNRRPGGACAGQTYPAEWQITTGSFWSDVVEWINVNFFDTLEAIKNALLLNLLIPFKRFLLELPWAGVAGLLALAGWRLGGLRLALLTGGLSFLIASPGQWEKAMITVYLCGISVVIACLIGSADRHRRRRARRGSGRWCRRSSTRCRPCRPSSI